jgi:RNA polymerase sigma-70 factor (ECF subfamily)
LENETEKIQQFVSFFTSHQGKIYSFILSLVPNFNDADDIMQETSKMMWVKFDEFQRGTDFVAWGIKIAHFRILEFRRKKKALQKIQFTDELTQDLKDKSEKRQDMSKEYLKFLKDCIRKLSLPDQDLILLRYQQNLKVKDISLRFGKSVQSVYQNMARIQELLLSCVKKSASVEG